MSFDPDKFILAKNDVLNILNRIDNRWKKNFKANYREIFEMQAVKLYFKSKSEESISKLWTEIINEIHEIMIDNSIKIDELDENSLLETFTKIRDGTKS